MIVHIFFWFLILTVVIMSVLCFINVNNESHVCLPNPSALCPADYNPVCGIDNITYTNSCEASKKCILIMHDGPCDTNIEH